MKKNWVHLLANVRNNPRIKTIFILVVILVLFFIIVTQSLQIVRMRYEMSNVNEKILEATNQNLMLKEEIQQMKTDKYIETMARENLGMVRSGETPVKVYFEEREETFETLKSQEKIGIYMKDWYVDLENWIKKMKKH